MNIPKKSVPYILFQRTEYLKDKLFFRILSKFGKLSALTHNLSISIKAKLYPSQIIEAFVQDIERDYSSIKNFLPVNVDKTLDIGCGMSLINIFISRHYKNNISIYLLDKDKLDKDIYYNYNPQTAYYNSFKLASETLSNNGVPEDNINTVDVTNASALFSENKFDLVMSFYSWGFHYPINTYLDQVYESLNTNGVLIIDINKNTDGLDILKKTFKKVDIIEEQKYAYRLIATK